MHNSFVWAALHIIGCLIGVFILGYGVVSWARHGFALGPGRFHPGAPGLSEGAPYFILTGLALAAYCAFAVYLDTSSSRRLDDDTTDGKMLGISDKKSCRSSLSCAAVFFGIGMIMFLRGRYADLHHTFIPGGSKAGWMNPWQAYAASIVCFAITAYALVLSFWKPSEDGRS